MSSDAEMEKKFLYWIVVVFGLLIAGSYAAESTGPLDEIPANKAIATSITMLDGVSYWKADDSGIECAFAYRPYLSSKPPYPPFNYLSDVVIIHAAVIVRLAMRAPCDS